MDIELRDLKASDMGAVCKILSGIGFKKFKDCFNVEGFSLSGDKDKDNEMLRKVGMSILLDISSIVVENMPLCQDDINRFLASVTGKTIKDIMEMPIADYGELIITVIQKDDFKDFFVRVVKLFNQSDM